MFQPRIMLTVAACKSMICVDFSYIHTPQTFTSIIPFLPLASQVLYDSVRVAAGLKPDRSDSLLDLYCGTGTIGLSLARHCRSVVGFEMNGESHLPELHCTSW